MTTPYAPISFADLNTEIGRPATQLVGLNEPPVRTLAQLGSPNSLIAMGNLRSRNYIPTVTIGTNNYNTSGTTPGPANNYYRRYKICAIYPYNSFVNAGWTGDIRITKLSFFVLSTPTYQPYPDYWIGLTNTYDGDGSDITSFESTQYIGSQSFTGGGAGGTENIITLPLPFYYYPSYGYNLGVAFAWGQCPTNWSATGNTLASFPGSLRYAASDAAGSYSLSDAAPTTQVGRPILRFYTT
jgi:hypothetical protein